jgi:hypothetical protein
VAPESGASARYELFGLLFESEIALTGVPGSPRTGLVDVVVRLGAIPQAAAKSEGYVLVEGGALLNVAEVGRYLVRPGEVVVEPAPGVSERNVRLYLLGSAMGALLHLRGLLPLHANAVDLGGRAVAFSGHSGAGKSTLAAWFHDRKYPILADDVCVLSFDAAGAPLAWPGIPRLRLWREALEASGRQAGEFERSFDDTEKYDVPTRSEGDAGPLPISAIYLLGRSDEDGPVGEISPLRGVEAVEALVSNTYRGAFVGTIGQTAAHLATCVRLARTVPIFRANRLWGFGHFDEQARRLERHALDRCAARIHPG